MYDVTITTELSSCGAEFFAFSDPFLLPTSYLPGHVSRMLWHIQRVGITASGDEKILLDMSLDKSFSSRLTVTGTLERLWLHVETSRSFTSGSCDVQRVVLISGLLEKTLFSGTINTVLSSGRVSETCQYPLPPNAVCEVAETFVAIRRKLRAK